MSDDIRRWREAGWIDAPTAEKLSADVAAQAKSRISFASVLAMLAALLFAAALLAFVAADWDAIPRPFRIGGIAALILLFTFGGAMLKLRNREGFAQAAWLAGSASWGAGIFLVGGMIEAPPNEEAAFLIWCLGTGFAAAAFASGPLTIAAVGLASLWLAAAAPWFGSDPGFPYGFLPLAAALWAVSLHSGSRRARELLLLSLVFFFFLLAQHLDALTVGITVTAAFAALFALAALRPAHTDALLKLDGHAPVLFLLNCMGGLAIVQSEVLDGAGFALSAAVVLAGIAAALLVGGRTSPGVRRLSYVAFAVELCVVFGVTVGTVLDTVSFFLAAAALLALLAVAVFRLERRWRAAPAAEARP